mmetsp:Transcript_91384/g.263781  ORF Transcript_91384/g.263781 Transcript_91384/m.263781 type:complete len:160 (+) Transcript_91384:35-514(+)
MAPRKAPPADEVGPFRGVAKPKGNAKAKAKGKAKAKAKAAAGLARGAAVMKRSGKMKMLADPTFKRMAKIAATKATASVPGKGKWFYMSDLRKMKVGAGDSKAWQAYSAPLSCLIERAWMRKAKQCKVYFAGKMYTVKFASMVQFRNDDPSMQRPVKRK